MTLNGGEILVTQTRKNRHFLYIYYVFRVHVHHSERRPGTAGDVY